MVKMNELQPAVLDEFRSMFDRWQGKMHWSWGQFVRYITALAHIESRANPKAFNAKYGATGLWQFIPKTWKAITGQDKISLDPVEQAKAYSKFTEKNLFAIGIHAPEYWQGYEERAEPDVLATTLATLHHAGAGNWAKNKIGPNTIKFQAMLKPLLWQSGGPGDAFERSFQKHIAAPEKRQGVLDSLLSGSKNVLALGALAAGVALAIAMSKQR